MFGLQRLLYKKKITKITNKKAAKYIPNSQVVSQLVQVETSGFIRWTYHVLYKITLGNGINV